MNLLGESDRQAQVACRIITSDLPPLHTHTKKGWGSHILSTRLPSVWLFHQSAIGLSLGYFFRISAGPPLLHSIECVSYRLMRRSEARVTPAGRAFAPQVFISNGSTGDRITRRTDGGDIRFELDENRTRFLANDRTDANRNLVIKLRYRMSILGCWRQQKNVSVPMSVLRVCPQLMPKSINTQTCRVRVLFFFSLKCVCREPSTLKKKVKEGILPTRLRQYLLNLSLSTHTHVCGTDSMSVGPHRLTNWAHFFSAFSV